MATQQNPIVNKDVTWLHIALIISVGSVWGFSFICLKVITPVFGPILTIQLRVFFAFVILVFYCKIMNHSLTPVKTYSYYFFAGLISYAIPFVFITIGVVKLGASTSSILNSTVPLFVVFVTHYWIHEPLTKNKIIGVILGMIGVIILIGFNPIPLGLDTIIGCCCCLFATLNYAVSGVFIKKYLQQENPITLTTLMLGAAAVLLFPVTLFNLKSDGFTLKIALFIIILSTFCTGAGGILFYKLNQQIGPTKAFTVTYLIPLFAVIWAFFLFDQPIALSKILGMAIILFSIFIITQIKLKTFEKNPPIQIQLLSNSN